jgi:hypothetical protein
MLERKADQQGMQQLGVLNSCYVHSDALQPAADVCIGISDPVAY